MQDKPAHIQNDSFVDDLYDMMAASTKPRPTIKFFHFTDLHLDLEYAEKSNAKCPEIICCRKENGFPEAVDAQAPKYGTWGCDIPVALLRLMGDYVNREIKPDVVLWTGDAPPHDQYNYNEEYVKMYQDVATDFMKSNFSNYTLYPLEGNHDFTIINSQNFDAPDPIVQHNLKGWDQWLDDQAKETFAKQGYYS